MFAQLNAWGIVVLIPSNASTSPEIIAPATGIDVHEHATVLFVATISVSDGMVMIRIDTAVRVMLVMEMAEMNLLQSAQPPLTTAPSTITREKTSELVASNQEESGVKDGLDVVSRIGCATGCSLGW